MKAYQEFLPSKFGSQWKRVGIQRRAGVATPLFSLYSKQSIGIGEFPDLKLLIDWCVSTRISILQLFPMNDVGFNFRPYDAESLFALDPMYVSIEKLKKAPVKYFKREISALRKKFPAGKPRVDYSVKMAKLALLRQIFSARHSEAAAEESNKEFKNYREKNKFWLHDYSLFRVRKDENMQKSWEEWPSAGEGLQGRETLFYEWLQWQAFEQFRGAQEYARAKKIFLMGDLPFLVSRDSADVWAHPEYFKLDLAAGAPPDLYFAKGQRWGMPPYDWTKIAGCGYDYLIEKLKYAENFYDLFRIDHFVGIFRIWTIRRSDPAENAGYYGAFDPPNENEWEEHGRRVLNAVVKNTRMLPCAEDLGAVPQCSYRVLEEFGIPGMDIQRWARDWGKTYDFMPSENYRCNSVATLSTHDMPPFSSWWRFEAGTVDEELLKIKCGSRNIDFGTLKEKLFDPRKSSHGRLCWKKEIKDVSVLLERLGLAENEARDFMDIYRSTYDEREKFWRIIGMPSKSQEVCSVELVKQVFFKINSGASIFSIQLLQDWLSLDGSFKGGARGFRINAPGTMSDKNWTLVMPYSLEKMKSLKVNKTIWEINSQTGRS